MGFTGHKDNAYIKLVYMNARFYVPYIGRFASTDTIVPDPANPQSYNRFSYVLNSPLMFRDPSGHFTVSAIQEHLYETYGDDWEQVYDTWCADTEWWSMLLAAQAGDMIYGAFSNISGTATELYYFKFLGSGHDRLSGITRVHETGETYERNRASSHPLLNGMHLGLMQQNMARGELL